VTDGSEMSVFWGIKAWTGVTPRAHLQRALKGTAGAGWKMHIASAHPNPGCFRDLRVGFNSFLQCALMSLSAIRHMQSTIGFHFYP